MLIITKSNLALFCLAIATMGGAVSLFYVTYGLFSWHFAGLLIAALLVTLYAYRLFFNASLAAYKINVAEPLDCIHISRLSETGARINFSIFIPSADTQEYFQMLRSDEPIDLTM